MNECRRTKKEVYCLTLVLLIALPIYAEAGLYKCIDEKTKAVTYSGIPCMTGDVSTLTVTENAVIDGHALQQEIARRKLAEQAGQQGQGCEAAAYDARQAASTRLAAAEERAQWAELHNNSKSGRGKNATAAANANAAVGDARAAYNSAGNCNPGATQQAIAAKDAAIAADESSKKASKASPRAAGVVTYSQSGNMLVGSDGTIYAKFGNQVVGSDGTTYGKFGNTVVRSDGVTYSKFGNSIVSSDGTTYAQFGNNIVGSDGTTCSTMGNITTCKK